MKVIVNSKKGLKTNLTISVDKKNIQEKISTRLEELSKTVNLKGFRPGKVPVNLLKQQFGKAVYGEVVEKILKETTTKAIEEKKIKVAGQPKLDLKSHGEDKDLIYNLEIDELPAVKLKPIRPSPEPDTASVAAFPEASIICAKPTNIAGAPVKLFNLNLVSKYVL